MPSCLLLVWCSRPSMPAHGNHRVSLLPSVITISHRSVPHHAPNQLVMKRADFDCLTHLHASSLLQIRTVDVHPTWDNTKRLVDEFRVTSLCFVQFGGISHEAVQDSRRENGCLCWCTSSLVFATAKSAATHTCSSTSYSCRLKNPFASAELQRQDAFVPTSVQSAIF